jgi:hypothetical protein
VTALLRVLLATAICTIILSRTFFLSQIGICWIFFIHSYWALLEMILGSKCKNPAPPTRPTCVDERVVIYLCLSSCKLVILFAWCLWSLNTGGGKCRARLSYCFILNPCFGNPPASPHQCVSFFFCPFLSILWCWSKWWPSISIFSQIWSYSKYESEKF